MGDEGMHIDTTLKKSGTAEVPVVKDRKSVSNSSETANDEKPHEIDEPPEQARNGSLPFGRIQTSQDVADYFQGPRDMTRHSKWPMFLRMHGSILPEMILPLTFVAGWATCIRCISFFVHNIGVNQVLLTVLGFVVGLGLSFRSSTAYERYNEGRKYWSQLVLASHNLARVIWIHGIERPDEQGKKDLLHKITGINLIVAFSVAVKHKLRWEPYTMYEDLEGLIAHLDTFAKDATAANPVLPKKPNVFKATGTYLGVSFAESNPMKVLKKSEKPTGNLPLEILCYLSSYVDDLVENGQLKVAMHQTLAYNNIASLGDALTGTDRILHTPLPIAYSIAISQITWVYIIMLPFQLDQTLKWIMIPATVLAAYIILGILMIGREIENPFGDDVNDLPLDAFCQQIAQDLDVICSRKKAKIADLVANENNKLLFPLSNLGYGAWASRSERVIREELKYKTTASFNSRRRANGESVDTIFEEPIAKEANAV